jgi:xanthine dehydrogenase YagS FAD-binding subunit
MKTLSTQNPSDLKQAVAIAARARSEGKTVAFAGGGSDLLGMLKDRIVEPDVIVHLRGIRGLDSIHASAHLVTIGGQTTLDTISRDPAIRAHFMALAEAAESVATPQIRNAGTIAGNVTQRPWCWYFRNGFKCYKAGGNTCYSATGENQLHAIFGGGPSFIVHPSDTAPALVAFGARFNILGTKGRRTVPAEQFFVLPKQNALRENVLAEDEILESIGIPVPPAGTKSSYSKIMDREAWTHAVVSVATVLEIDKGQCRSARIVLGGVAPIPWRVPEAERALAGQRLTPELASQAGEMAVKGAAPLAHNGYKIQLAKSTVSRAIQALA